MHAPEADSRLRSLGHPPRPSRAREDGDGGVSRSRGHEEAAGMERDAAHRPYARSEEAIVVADEVGDLTVESEHLDE
eukprot:CAMPEP_0185557384 /NCGR_PEP_ID=MMETSP1381-20130426/49639_1 /TAXON_ID=298111 /ORGANISM="Pavlova sp., Strain CCMP459" /LENGTH=76 /DNA_ID=CAMNT_0028170835 /DNA_START=81 /DNA_END=308 /DNA_ORIENTATION=-